MAIMKNVKIAWAKVIGPARPKYNPRDGNEWSVDLLFTKDQLKALAKEGFTVAPFLKKAKDGSYEYIRYTRDETDADGKPKNRIKIVGPDGKTDWPQDKLLGNDTVVDIKYKLTDPYKVKGETRVKLVVMEMMIREHKPYEGGDTDSFTPILGGGSWEQDPINDPAADKDW